MSDAPSPLDNLRTLRSILVERRREIAISAVEEMQEWANVPNYKGAGAKGADRGPVLKAVQDSIEAVDRAIADEDQLALGSRGIPL